MPPDAFDAPAELLPSTSAAGRASSSALRARRDDPRPTDDQGNVTIGTMAVVTTYGLDDDSLDAERSRWEDWWRSGYPKSSCSGLTRSWDPLFVVVCDPNPGGVTG